MQKIDDLISALKLKQVNYKSILNNKNNIFQNNNCDISVVIETKGDRKLLLKCLAYIKHSIAQSSLKVGIVVVESNNLPSLRLYTIENGASYVFINKNNHEFASEYSSALSYNVGSFVNLNSTYIIFNDVNILLPHDFFTKLEKRIKQGLVWFENFYNNNLFIFSREQSKNILLSNKIFNLYQYNNLKNIKPLYFGLSLTIKKDLFKEIGGFDVELNLLKPLENELFKNKILLMRKNIEQIMPDELYSAFLLTQNFRIKKTLQSQRIFDAFCNAQPELKIKYINSRCLVES